MAETKFDDQTMSWKLDYSDDIVPYRDVLRQVVEAIKHDRGQKVRRALIELGWTPPPTHSRRRSDVP